MSDNGDYDDYEAGYEGSEAAENPDASEQSEADNAYPEQHADEDQQASGGDEDEDDDHAAEDTKAAWSKHGTAKQEDELESKEPDMAVINPEDDLAHVMHTSDISMTNEDVALWLGRIRNRKGAARDAINSCLEYARSFHRFDIDGAALARLHRLRSDIENNLAAAGSVDQQVNQFRASFIASTRVVKWSHVKEYLPGLAADGIPDDVVRTCVDLATQAEREYGRGGDSLRRNRAMQSRAVEDIDIDAFVDTDGVLPMASELSNPPPAASAASAASASHYSDAGSVASADFKPTKRSRSGKPEPTSDLPVASPSDRPPIGGSPSPDAADAADADGALDEMRAGGGMLDDDDDE